MTKSTFQPDWAVPPGATIADVLNARGISVESFAPRIGVTASEALALIRGDVAINRDTARKLESEVGASAKFWLTRETIYRDALLRISGGNSEDDSEWLDMLPIADMRRLGWIEANTQEANLLPSCLRFFGVPNVSAFSREILPLLQSSAFRTSPSFGSTTGAVAAWLRKGQIEAEAISCECWSAEAFRIALDEVRRLTRKHNPEVFLPALRTICAGCGVAVAIVQAPSGCRASGATRFLTSNKAMLQLSFRYLSDDHFWFTFFHEAGHLLLHNPASLFLEGLEGVADESEKEANQFAEDILLPIEFRSELRNAAERDPKFVIRIARQIGISPGIIVGQLQHWGWIGRNRFNMLKTRFQWETK